MSVLLFLQAIVMLDKTDRFKNIEHEMDTGDSKDKFSKIRCPACKWRPTAASRWVCFDEFCEEHPMGGCFTDWNTFDTRGVCPGCQHHWKNTTCLWCGVHSPHEEWYE